MVLNWNMLEWIIIYDVIICIKYLSVIGFKKINPNKWLAIVSKSERTKDECFLWDELKIASGFPSAFIKIKKGNTPKRPFLSTAVGGGSQKCRLSICKGLRGHLLNQTRGRGVFSELSHWPLDKRMVRRDGAGAHNPVAIYYSSKAGT